jgi:hypothetical protein
MLITQAAVGLKRFSNESAPKMIFNSRRRRGRCSVCPAMGSGTGNGSFPQGGKGSAL